MKTLLLILAGGLLLSVLPSTAEAQVLRRRDPFERTGQPEYQYGYNDRAYSPNGLPQRGHFRQDYQWNVWPQEQWEYPYGYEESYQEDYPYAYDYGYDEDYGPWDYGWVPYYAYPYWADPYGDYQNYNYGYDYDE